MDQKKKQGRTLKGTRDQLNHRETAQNLIHRLTRLRDFLVELKENM
jgi:hypothetical protein